MKTKPTVSKMLTGIEKAGKLLLVSGTLITANVQESKGQWNLGIFPDYRTINIRSVGIGFFTPGNRPLAALHINENLMLPSPFFPQGEVFRTDCPSTQNTFWRMFRGGAQYGTLYNNAGSPDFNINAPQANSSIHFQNAGNTMMKVSYTPPTNEPRVLISNQPISAQTYLHIGQSGGGGFRPWMNIGTYYNHSGNHMYVGIRNIASNMNEEIINWGDDGYDPNNPSPTADVLRFVFTAPLGLPVFGSDTLGREACRMINSFNHVYTGFGGDINPNFNNPYTSPDPFKNGEPGNTVEINSFLGNKLGSPSFPNTLGGTGASGLRFTDLNTTSTPVKALAHGVDSTKVLSVDKNGDVVLVRVGGGTGNADNGLSLIGPTPNQIHLGQSVGALGNPARLLDDREIPMNNFNLIFRDPIAPLTPSKNRIELGEVGPIPAFFNCKLSVNNLDNTTFRVGGYYSTIYNVFPYSSLVTNPFYFNTIVGIKKMGIVGIGVDTTTNAGKAIGISGYGYTSSNYQGNLAIGVSGKAYSNNGTFNTFGIYGYVDGNAVISNAGYFYNSSVSNMNFGAQAIVPMGNTSVLKYALYSLAPPPTSGITTTNNNYAGFFNGGVYNAVNIVPSDQLMKKNIQPLNAVLNKLFSLHPIKFEFDTSFTSSYHLSLPLGIHYGITAQEISNVFPELIQIVHKPEEYDTLGNVSIPFINFKGVNYIGFIPILIQAIKEQQQVIDSLLKKDSILNSQLNQIQNTIQTLSNTINACCSNNNNNKFINNTNITLSTNDAIVLNQNVPNPFAEKTTIQYHVPEKYTSAQIIFTTVNGQVLKTVDISNKKSNGQITVFADDLSSGMYIYYLIVDGKVMETRKMEKQ